MDNTSLIHGNEQKLLAQMFGSSVSPDAGAEKEGDGVGPFRLVERLGEGGFGIVWKAVQTDPVEREVALKVIKRGMDTVQVLARFDQERQTLAGMEHPGIAAMLDAGSSVDGRPYFAMELVRGEPINQWCERRRSPIHERLRLFIQVCYAVQHAHQKGIIHRDLKPSNILVTSIDALPTPKIIDFGIAKAMRRTTLQEISMLTHADQVVGTPLYMSPEQIDGGEEVDTRSDIYALGVILYELLTGSPPFQASVLNEESLDRIKERIKDEQPERPSTLMRIRGRREGNQPPVAAPFDSSLPDFSSDLDWITMCALEKDRDRRYQTAADLAADLKRFLQMEPVHARPPSFKYLAARWIARNQLLFAAACAVTLTLLGGTAVSLWQAERAKLAQQRAEAESARAHVSEQAALETSERARKTAEFVTGLLDRVIEEIERGKNPEALKSALVDSQRRISQLGPDLELRSELLARVAGIYEAIGESKSLLPLLEARVETEILRFSKRSREAVQAEIELLKMVVDHGNRAEGPARLRSLREVVEAEFGEHDLMWFEVQRQLIRVLSKLRFWKDAQEEAERCLTALEAHPVPPTRKIAIILLCVGVFKDDNNLPRARELLDLAEKSVPPGDEERYAVTITEERLAVMAASKDRKGVLEESQKATSRACTLMKVNPEKAVHQLFRLIPIALDAQLQELAIQQAAEAVSGCRRIHSISAELPEALSLQAEALSAGKRHKEAIQAAEEALAVARGAGRASAVRHALEALAGSYRDAGDYERAVRVYDEHLSLVASAHANYKDKITVLEDLVSVRLLQRDTEAAKQSALKMWEAVELSSAAIVEPSFRQYVARQVAKTLDAHRKAHPSEPEPPEAIAIRAAALNAK